MSNLDTTRTIMDALEVPDFDVVKQHITDDWVVEGPAPIPLGWDEFRAVHGGIVRGFSDFTWHVSNMTEDGDTVSMDVSITGTHDQTVDVPMLGVVGYEATGTRVNHPSEHITFTFDDGKVSKVDVSTDHEGAGMVGLLEAIGAEIAVPGA